MAETIIHGNQNTTKLINQLKNSIKQYPCLTKDQERQMIDDNRGNRDRLNQLLFMHNIRIVFSMAKKYMAWTRDYDALIQNGMIGLGEACSRFDIDRDIKFCTYATLWVKKYMTMYFYSTQYTKIDQKTISINSPSLTSDVPDANVSAEDSFENCIGRYADPSAGFGDAVKPVENQISSNEQVEICRDLYNIVGNDTSLSAMDKEVFEKIFVDHEKTRDVATMYHIDMTAVGEIKNRILDKMRGILKTKYKINSFLDLAM